HVLFVRSQSPSAPFGQYYLAYTNMSAAVLGLNPALSSCSPCNIVQAVHETPKTIIVLVDGGVNLYLARLQINGTLRTAGGFLGGTLPLIVATPAQPTTNVASLGNLGFFQGYGSLYLSNDLSVVLQA